MNTTYANTITTVSCPTKAQFEVFEYVGGKPNSIIKTFDERAAQMAYLCSGKDRVEVRVTHVEA